RLQGDWSSDVCSSDLAASARLIICSGEYTIMLPGFWPSRDRSAIGCVSCSRIPLLIFPTTSNTWLTALRSSDDDATFRPGDLLRSEERRVGKECMCWW